MHRYNLGIAFEDIVGRYPERPALRFSPSGTVFYKELNLKANQLANFLIESGVKQNDVVCISGKKTLETFACMIACLKIGAIYSMLDPYSPFERLKKIISTCSPKILFIDNALEQALEGIISQFNIIVINNEAKEVEDKIRLCDEANLKITRKITGSNPAYIMFTSGSTGFPKGAVMTHDNLLNLISWSIETFDICPEDIITNVNPLYFDNSVFDFSSALFSGACLAPFSKDIIGNPMLFVSQIDELKCTLWFSVPSLLIYLDTMKVLNKGNMRFIKRFVFGGEGYPKPKLKHLYDIYSDRSNFFNVYGPTECTCICSSYKIGPKDFQDFNGFPPLGKMADNFSYLILDGMANKVVPNEIGELCLLGPNVGQGYYNDTERTRESFVRNPYNVFYSEIMYKTGDLVRYNPEDDFIYFVGRKDNQIKHMGYRIELEEVETALNRLGYISQAAVLHGYFRELSQIVAVVSIKSAVDEKKIRDDLRQIIPDYMVPNRIFVEKELPKNPNGKIDKRKLAEIYLT